MAFWNFAGLHERVDHSRNAACEAPSSNRNNRRDSAHQIRLANNSIDEYRPNLTNGANFSVISNYGRIDGLAVVSFLIRSPDKCGVIFEYFGYCFSRRVSFLRNLLDCEPNTFRRNLGFILLPFLIIHETVLRGEGLFVTLRTLKDGLFWLADYELLVVDVQL